MTRIVNGIEITNIASVKAAHQAGELNKWFTPGAMRFFNSKVPPNVYGNRYFVTSEQYDYDSPRLYTIREIMDDGSINTVGEFQQYETLTAARVAARKLVQDQS